MSTSFYKEEGVTVELVDSVATHASSAERAAAAAIQAAADAQASAQYVHEAVDLLTTSDIPEGSNLYFTVARTQSVVDDAIDALTTSDVPEGDNMYFTAGRAETVAASVVNDALSDLTTSDVPEGSNQYFTTARAAAAAPVQSVAGKTGNVTLDKTDVGLPNVDNTADIDKPISAAVQEALDLKADMADVVPKTGGAFTGNVGIGTDTPERKLEISSPAWADHLRLTRTSTTASTGVLELAAYNADSVVVEYANIYGILTSAVPGSESGALVFGVRRSGSLVETMRILPNGNIGIGSTYPETGLAVRGTTPEKARVRIEGAGTDVGGSLDLFSEGSVFRIQGRKMGNGGGVVLTQIGVRDLATFDGGGNFMVGQSAVNTSSSNTAPGVSIAPLGYLKVTRNENCGMFHRTEGTGPILSFAQGVSNVVGTISVTTSSTSYNTSSDYRLWWKEGAQPLTGSGEFIDRLKPYYFPLVGMAGFFAHEFSEVSPSSVAGEKDAVDESGEPIYQSMQASTSDVMANIIAELQSLRSRVAALEEALAATEAEPTE